MEYQLKPIFYWPDGFWFYQWLQAENPALAWNQTYRKQRNFNRASIVTANGIFNLSVPVMAKNGCSCADVQIDNSISWATQHKKAIEYAYKNAAYFDYYFDDILLIYKNTYQNLNDLNISILQFIFKKISLTNLPIIYNQNINGLFAMRTTEIPDTYIQKPYFQLFGDSFTANMSIIDVLMNLGPETQNWIKNEK